MTTLAPSIPVPVRVPDGWPPREELRENRCRWFALLRRSPQLKDLLWDRRGGFCFMGALLFALNGGTYERDFLRERGLLESCGLPVTAFMPLARMNNEGMSFHSLMAYVERVYPI